MKKTYLLQLVTTDLDLMLLAEVSSVSLAGLKIEAAKMVRNNPIVKGMSYRVFSVVGNQSKGFVSKMLKEAVISG